MSLACMVSPLLGAAPGARALPCSLASNRDAPWLDVGPAGYSDLDGRGVASSGAGQAAAQLNGTTRASQIRRTSCGFL